MRILVCTNMKMTAAESTKNGECISSYWNDFITIVVVINALEFIEKRQFK